jgi:iron complex transport system ATP-binding protein
MESSKPILSLHELAVGYQAGRKKNRAVYGPVNAAIEGPEMVALIGRNGIGKSTLLRTIAGIQKPLHGKVCYRGAVSDNMGRAEMARLVSFVSTEPVTVQHLRVLEMVTLGRYPHTSRFSRLGIADHRIIHDALERTGIYELRYKFLHELSDGERQKVMIARALAQDTAVMILDEPTAFLDLPARHEILRLLSVLTQQKFKLILFSTHDLSITIREADKLWLMTPDGLLQGAPEDLLISGGFRNLFMNSGLRFDAESMSFVYDRDKKAGVSIEAEGEMLNYTVRALERIGFFKVSDGETDIHVRVDLESGHPQWVIRKPVGETRFGSLYELTSYLYLTTR